MDITFLGTGSGKTDPEKYHSSLFIEFDDSQNLLIDSGDSISRCLQRNYIDYSSIQNILITHTHSDHLAGLPSLLTQMKICRRKEALKIFVHKKHLGMISHLLKIFHLPLEFLDFEAELVPFEHGAKTKIKINSGFIAYPNTHILPEEKYTSPGINPVSSSIKIFENDMEFFYTSDIGTENDLINYVNYPYEIFITECGHVSLNAMGKILKSIISPKIYLIHYHSEELPVLRDWIKSLEPELQKKIMIAYDSLRKTIR